MSKTTLDLSTLSDISDGTHTVKVKAKADGYRDSEFSNEVSWTKSSGFTVTLVNSAGRDLQYSLNGTSWLDINSGVTITINDISIIWFIAHPTKGDVIATSNGNTNPLSVTAVFDGPQSQPVSMNILGVTTITLTM